MLPHELSPSSSSPVCFSSVIIIFLLYVSFLYSFILHSILSSHLPSIAGAVKVLIYLGLCSFLLQPHFKNVSSFNFLIFWEQGKAGLLIHSIQESDWKGREYMSGAAISFLFMEHCGSFYDAFLPSNNTFRLNFFLLRRRRKFGFFLDGTMNPAKIRGVLLFSHLRSVPSWLFRK